jgi:hypothetical protein
MPNITATTTDEQIDQAIELLDEQRHTESGQREAWARPGPRSTARYTAPLSGRRRNRPRYGMMVCPAFPRSL